MLTEEKKIMLEHYNKGLQLYKNRQFQDAMDKFKEALGIVPDDGPSKLYIDRCKLFIKDPPGEDWDGVFVMKTK